jgi:hypothetical protein
MLPVQLPVLPSLPLSLPHPSIPPRLPAAQLSSLLSWRMQLSAYRLSPVLSLRALHVIWVYPAHALPSPLHHQHSTSPTAPLPFSSFWPLSTVQKLLPCALSVTTFQHSLQ